MRRPAVSKRSASGCSSASTGAKRSGTTVSPGYGGRRASAAVGPQTPGGDDHLVAPTAARRRLGTYVDPLQRPERGGGRVGQRLQVVAPLQQGHPPTGRHELAQAAGDEGEVAGRQAE